MNAEQWRQVKPILESALEVRPSARKDYLDSKCADASLSREGDSLLAHDQAAPEMLTPGVRIFQAGARFILYSPKRFPPLGTDYPTCAPSVRSRYIFQPAYAVGRSEIRYYRKLVST